MRRAYDPDGATTGTPAVTELVHLKTYVFATHAVCGTDRWVRCTLDPKETTCPACRERAR